MQVPNNRFRTLTAALAIGALGIGFAASASATATYSALAGFEIEFVSVQDDGGTDIPSNGGANWYVEAEGFILPGNDDAIWFGDAFAQTSNMIQPFALLNTGDLAGQESGSSGEATDGYAESFAFTNFEMFVENTSGQPLTFDFLYSALVDTLVGGAVASRNAASAGATVDVLDDLGFVDVLLSAFADLQFGPTSDRIPEAGGFSIRLQSGESDLVEGFIDSFGFAVPEPASIVLLAAGLIGVGVIRLRKAA